MKRTIDFYKFLIPVFLFISISIPVYPFGGHPFQSRVLSLSKKTHILYAPSSDSDRWKALHLIDGLGDIGWRSKKNSFFPHVIVFEMTGVANIDLLKFNNNTEEKIYPGISTREVNVEFSTSNQESGYINIGSFILEKSKKNQEYRIQKTKAKWVRLTITSNYGNQSYTELMEFEAWGVYDLNLLKIISNLMWILGVALIIFALGYHAFLAHIQKAKIIEAFKRDSFKKPFLLGTILIATGISASAHQLWLTAIFGIVALLLIIWSIKIIKIQATEKQEDRD